MKYYPNDNIKVSKEGIWYVEFIGNPINVFLRLPYDKEYHSNYIIFMGTYEECTRYKYQAEVDLINEKAFRVSDCSVEATNIRT